MNTPLNMPLKRPREPVSIEQMKDVPTNRVYAWRMAAMLGLTVNRTCILLHSYGVPVFENEEGKAYVLRDDLRAALTYYAPSETDLS